jgi:hypothetical protein
MNCILKELHCVFEAPLDVLKFDLWFVIGDLNFPTKQRFSLHYIDAACTSLNGHRAIKSAVLVLV